MEGSFNYTFYTNNNSYVECYHEYLFSGNNFLIKSEIAMLEKSLKYFTINVDTSVYSILIDSGAPFVFFDDFQYS